MPEPAADSRNDEVDRALSAWRQGDCVVESQWFVHRIDPAVPLTDAAKDAASQGVDLAEEEVLGLVVVSQTCDVVRSCKRRHYVEVSPLVEVDAAKLHEIELGRRPAYGYLPGVADRRLVADLDRVMTVEKPVVAKWQRTQGCATDRQTVAFSRALARKRARFAFPDDFEQFVGELQRHIKEKPERASREGRALQRLKEIRVSASPSWSSASVSLSFLFIRDPVDDDFEGEDWSALRDEWLALIPASGRFGEVDGLVTTLDELTASEYVQSHPLDLDHLSVHGGSTNE